MIMSENTDKLFAALSKFQGQITPARKSRKGHGYSYADLVDCIEAAQEALANNGLGVLQTMGDLRGEASLITMLTHSSGQHVGSEFVMERAILHGGAKGNPAQEMGASITYMRRYAYAAILGLAQEDNDAANVKKQQARKPAPQKKSPPPQQKVAMMTDPQLKRLMVAYKGVQDHTRKAHASKIIGRNISSFKELTKAEANMIIDKAEQAEKKNADPEPPQDS